jgi:hypothetical protein
MIDEEALIEQLGSAHRERGPLGQVRSAAAFHDLSEAARERAFQRTQVLRKLEAALDADGLSSTARAVLARIHGSAG